jgi:hypothetical protein
MTKPAIGMMKWRNEYDLEQFKVKEFLLLFLCLSLLRATTYTQDRGAAFEERNYSPSFINPTKGTSKCQNPSPETNYQ